jgi:predicted Rossmann fold nucleotide-binding protein DprA/Smf involved in DNA uptake
VTPIAESIYSRRATTIADPPPVLWVRGDRGAQRAVGGDCRIARRVRDGLGRRALAGDPAACGLVIVSGPARGVTRRCIEVR